VGKLWMNNHDETLHSADIGISTDTTSTLSSTCFVLALMAGHQNCQL